MKKEEIEGFFLLGGGYTRKGADGRMMERARVATLLSLCAEARRLSPVWRKYDHDFYIAKIRSIKITQKIPN